MILVNLWVRDYYPDLTDYVIIGVYLVIIFIAARNYEKKRYEDNPVYKYFTLGLFAKIAGAISYGLIYLLYYKGAGDTTGYYYGGEVLINMLFYQPKIYFDILFNGLTPESLSHFTIETGWPTFRHDPSSFMVNRITSIFVLIGFHNYFTVSILFSTFFYWGTWKIFRVFGEVYPDYLKHLSWAILLFPSVLFWASGISKDTLALSLAGLFFWAFYQIAIRKKHITQNALLLFITGYFIIIIKAYILVALLPGILFWVGYEYLRYLKNPLFRFLVAPVVSMVFLLVAMVILANLQQFLGTYGSIDGIVYKAIETYEDHTRFEQYGTGFYELGEFDGTLGNFFSKAPLAIITAFFRPMWHEVTNIVMVLSALENSLLLIIVLVIFWRTGLAKGIKITFNEPLVIFSLLFAIVFGFSVGISSGNFGALVRLKTPMLPFFTAAFAVLFNKSMEHKKEKEKPVTRQLNLEMPGKTN